ncbi:respiratory nitrate reductase subunit gamma [Nocardia sp. CDC159]|uniref:Respiratory nitrate reductase subunit gamma n=1 Tax=Nocardia pulmonis TaxID=2951408 RepID=A0A9X2E7V4_9NOCA|nr:MULTISPECIES: respiratory nitrate reductase subunit gamma [Nocardia]MCM6775917.1 respiratory nitrate reductase subunit gamma [Nocardia pulmonis]MCM6788107.1 respiratory nitrate reductase subunit gamma [Nocardia sp. CDC159]
MMSALWIILPYSAFACFALGHLWRYRYDRFGRPEPGPDAGRLERLGPNLFRIGVAGAVLARTTDMLAARPGPHTWIHTAVTVVELAAQPLAILGALLLIVPPLITAVPRSRVSWLDRCTLPVLAAVALSRVAITFAAGPGAGENLIEDTLFVWFRSLFTPHPTAETMLHAPPMFQARGLILLLLIAIWPYTRLGGTFAGPLVRLAHRLAAEHRLPQRFPVRARVWTGPRPVAGAGRSAGRFPDMQAGPGRGNSI